MSAASKSIKRNKLLISLFLFSVCPLLVNNSFYVLVISVPLPSSLVCLFIFKFLYISISLPLVTFRIRPILVLCTSLNWQFCQFLCANSYRRPIVSYHTLQRNRAVSLGQHGFFVKMFNCRPYQVITIVGRLLVHTYVSRVTVVRAGIWFRSGDRLGRDVSEGLWLTTVVIQSTTATISNVRHVRAVIVGSHHASRQPPS